MCLFSRAGGQGLLPSSFPLRSGWQEAGRSADSHGEGISKAKGSFLALLQEDEVLSPGPLLLQPFPMSLPSPMGEAGHSLGVPHHPHTQWGGKPAPRRVLAHLPLPLNPPHPPAASNWCPCPLVPCPSNRAHPQLRRGCSEDHSPVQLLCSPSSLVPRFQVLVLDLLKVLQQLRVVDVGGCCPLEAGAGFGAVPAGREQSVRCRKGQEVPTPRQSIYPPRVCPEEAEPKTP